jgi:hypothetical protein
MAVCPGVCPLLFFRAVINLGLLLSHAGQGVEAEQTYRRAVEVRKDLGQANPQNIELTVGYAVSLCSVSRFEEAEPLVDRVLREVSQHPCARQLKAHILSMRGVDDHGGQQQARLPSSGARPGTPAPAPARLAVRWVAPVASSRTCAGQAPRAPKTGDKATSLSED